MTFGDGLGPTPETCISSNTVSLMASTANYSKSDGTQVISLDPSLTDHRGHFVHRYQKFLERLRQIEENEGGLDKFSRGFERFGLHAVPGGLRHTEWAPLAESVGVIGDFNGWDRSATPMEVDSFGVWSCFIPNNPDGSPKIKHGDKFKLAMVTANKEAVERLPAYAKYCVQDPSSPCYPTLESVRWAPDRPYTWMHPDPPRPKSLIIYEAHVGMASEEGKVATYNEFADNIIPKIAKMGYTAVQLMAVQEHPYYASFGYHVTSFFAPSSRFGTPDDLKRLVDVAHSFNIVVIMDIVHSHSANNVNDGINMFDGTDHCYFHGGSKGIHTLWDSRLFNYGSWEVLRFLLSNVRWWLEEYHFDGFRFDGVTSILYDHHGIGTGFTGGYHEYFSGAADIDACVYLMLANTIVHERHCISIAEDVSGMPTLCKPVIDGGFGFDFRLAMSIPDQWIKLLKEFKDDDWGMSHIVFNLTNRRRDEGVIAYAESHDQALVGDKTIAFWLMDKEMYTGMSKLADETPIVFRGIALHKCIRLITYALGGDAYLNFMGNEFGHPEWIDFPREGNNNSYHYCRRQWSLATQDHLRYESLLNFDIAMHKLEQQFPWLHLHSHEFVSLKHEGDKTIAFEKGKLLFVFNFHPTKSFENYRIGTLWPGRYRVVLDSDAAIGKVCVKSYASQEFGGHSRHDNTVSHHAVQDPWCDRPYHIQIYIASRSALVFASDSV